MRVSSWEIKCYFSVFNKFLSCYWNGFTWNNHNYKITKGKLKIAVWETHPPSNYSHDQCFTWNLNWSFKLSYTSKPQNPTNTSKQIAPIPTPPTFHVKHQASATNRGKATHPKRYLLQLNHPIMFHVKPLFHIPHSPNLRFTWNIRKLSNVRKAQH